MSCPFANAFDVPACRRRRLQACEPWLRHLSVEELGTYYNSRTYRQLTVREWSRYVDLVAKCDRATRHGPDLSSAGLLR